jgi:drug/metabolite transporter (DMT)-like permease
VPPALKGATTEPQYRPWLGILFMCIACAMFPVQNAVVKMLTSLYPFQEVVWVRLATHLLLMCIIFLPRRGLALLRTRAPVQQVICSAGLLGATFFFFSAAKDVGVTEAIAISFISPLVVTFLAWPILGERITIIRLASVVIGFAGVLIVIRPGSSVFQWASLLIVASSVSYAVYQIIVRRVAAVDSPATTAFYSALGCTLVTSLIVPFHWRTPDNWVDIALMLSLGVSGGLGHYCVARAFSYAPANLIAPLNYTQMIGSVVVGYLVFAEVPDLYTWIGSAVIIAAGLLVGWQGRKRTS